MEVVQGKCKYFNSEKNVFDQNIYKNRNPKQEKVCHTGQSVALLEVAEFVMLLRHTLSPMERYYLILGNVYVIKIFL